MRLLYGALVVLVPFVLHYNYILNAFYHFGAVYFDAGLFANLIWHNDFLLTNSRLYGSFSYLGVHFSPFLVLLNQLSYCVPTHKVEFYAAFIATIYASLGAMMYYALLACVRPQRQWHLAALAAIALAFAFGGVVLQGIWMPHFEYAIPMGIFLFLLHYRRGNTGWAIFFFLLTLSLREDAGFHLASMLGLLICLDYVRIRNLRPLIIEIVILTVAISYSAFAWWMTFHMRALSGISGSVFEQIYTGAPPYAHLSFDQLAMRAHIMFSERMYIWLAGLITLGWGIWKRNPYLLVGFVACMPWFILNWASTNDNSGTLYAYYAFPFVLAMGWPPLAAVWVNGTPLPPDARRDVLVLQSLLVIVGLVVWNPYAKAFNFGPAYFSLGNSYRLIDGTENREAVRHFADALDRSETLGRVIADAGVSSLTVGSPKQNATRLILWRDESLPVDTIVYMHATDAPPEREIREQIEKNQLPSHYCVADTSICLFTNRTYDQLGIFTSMLIEKPVDFYVPGLSGR